MMTFTYKGSEALEMLQKNFPKTWEEQIKEGQIFIKSVMKMYNLGPVEAFQKYIKYCGTLDKGIASLASLHVMTQQIKIGDEVKQLQEQQLNYGEQLTALEGSQIIPYDEKKTLRSFYLSKQAELQKQIDLLISDYPVIGAEKIIVQTNLFED